MTPPIRLIAITILGVVLITGIFMLLKWESPPAEKLAAAQKAVNEARATGAQILMADEFAKLESLLVQAKTEIEEQNAKVGFLRSYANANRLLDTVLAEAARLRVEAGKRRDDLKTAAIQAQQGAQETVMLAQDLLEEAPGGKERSALALIKADVQKLNKSLAEANAAMESGDYASAEAKAKDIRVKADEVVAGLRRAIDKATKATTR